MQALHQNFLHFKDPDTCSFQCLTGSFSIFEKKVRNADPIHPEASATFDAHARATESSTHLSKGTGPIIEFNAYVEHFAFLKNPETSVLTQLRLLLHSVFRRISIAEDELVLQLLALLVNELHGLAVWRQ